MVVAEAEPQAPPAASRRGCPRPKLRGRPEFLGAEHAPPAGTFQVPWAPPEDDGESAVGGDGAVERRVANAVTLSQVLAREVFSADGMKVVTAL